MYKFEDVAIVFSSRNTDVWNLQGIEIRENSLGIAEAILVK